MNQQEQYAVIKWIDWIIYLGCGGWLVYRSIPDGMLITFFTCAAIAAIWVGGYLRGSWRA